MSLKDEFIKSADEYEFLDNYFDCVKKVVERINREEVVELIRTLRRAQESKARVFIAGNGGSAALASHMSNDLARLSGGYSLRTLALCESMSQVTCLANDFSYEEVFSKQLEVMAEKDDLLVVLSASGNSGNIIRAMRKAKDQKVKTIALCGFDGGVVRNEADQYVHIQTEVGDYGLVEDAFLMINHILVYELGGSRKRVNQN